MGGRPASIGGHDPTNPIRSNINLQIYKILQEQIKKHELILGLTGLTIGVEQDFAEICLNLKIDFNVYLAYEQMSKKWGNLPHIKEKYDYLLSKALNTIVLNKTTYSPVKNYNKNLILIREADLVIYVNNPIKKNCVLLDEIKQLNKELIII